MIRLTASQKLPCGRSVEPAETIRRLEAVIGSRYPYRLYEEQVAEHLFWAALFIDGLDFRAMGKGVTAELSRAGALAEAAEWLACRDVERLPGYTVAHQDELDPESILPIESLLPHIATATPPVIARIKELDAAQFWVDGWSLTHERTVKVPLVYAETIAGPNGKAAGNTLEEAIEHAVLEIFERRAHITVLRNRMTVPTIDPDTVREPLLREQMATIRARGIGIVLKDLSFGGVLPCIGAYFTDPAVPEAYQFRRFFKVGAAFDREEALMRTLTEFVQGRRRDEFVGDDPAALERLLEPDFRGLRAVPPPCDNFLSAFMFGFMPGTEDAFLQAGEQVAFDQGVRSGDSREDVRAALAVCGALGKDMIVVDLTDPAIGFPVVRVIVPGYSDVLPFHPPGSPGLFRQVMRSEVLEMYRLKGSG